MPLPEHISPEQIAAFRAMGTHAGCGWLNTFTGQPESSSFDFRIEMPHRRRESLRNAELK